MTCVRLALTLLVLAGLVAVTGPLLETRERAPEGIARAYLRAVEAGDLDGALALLDPAIREDQREAVALQLRNQYTIVTLVLGRPSVVDRVSGRPAAPAWVVVQANVDTISGERWQSTSTAPLVERNGHWFLTRPLFA